MRAGSPARFPFPDFPDRVAVSAALLIEQVLNGLQFGVMLFLMAAGLTLIFGVMGLINLAHGSLYMVGAFACAAVAAATGSFWLGLMASLIAAALAGAIVEIVVIRRLYRREHLDQVLAHVNLDRTIHATTTVLFHLADEFRQRKSRNLALPVIAIAKQIEVF